MVFVKARLLKTSLLLLLLPLPVVADQPETLKLEVGRQQMVTHANGVKRVAVGDPAVAGVAVLTTQNLMVTGKGAGTTEVSLWERDNQSQPSRVLRIEVGAATGSAAQRLEAGGASPLKVTSAGAGLALTGWAKSLEQHALAQQALSPEAEKPLDASESGFDSQVQIDIKVVEVSRQSMMRAGLFLSRNRSSSTIAISSPGTLAGVENVENGLVPGVDYTLRSAAGFLPIMNAFNLVLGNAGSSLLGAISVLEANGFAYTLAEPSLTAISGQSATFLAGGEYPVPIRTGSGADSSITIHYKEYGVRLMLTPTVLEANRIFLKVSPEVSELDFNNVVQTGGVTVPGLRVRRTDTSVALGNGESFVISGLVSRNTINNVDKFPWLGDLPIIGPFFRSTRFDREDKELLMVVTPHLVRPLARGTTTPALPGSDVRDYKPSFSELFFQTGSARGAGASSTGMSR